MLAYGEEDVDTAIKKGHDNRTGHSMILETQYSYGVCHTVALCFQDSTKSEAISSQEVSLLICY